MLIVPTVSMQNSASSRPGLRDELIWRLQRASFGDRQNCRNRFIPNSALLDILNRKHVQQLLTTSEDQPIDLEARKFNRICPESGLCDCSQRHCTGLRIVLAILLLIGKEHSILSILSSAAENICDNDLPFRQIPQRLGGDDQTGRSTRILNALQISSRIDDTDRHLFESLQWQFLTPVIHKIERTGATYAKFPYEISLPWAETFEDRKPEEGAPSHVRRLQIYPEFHDLVSITYVLSLA